MSVEFVTEEYVVPVWALAVLINGDESGISDDDCNAVTAFETGCIDRAKEAGSDQWHFSATDDDGEFSVRNDITGWTGDTVVDIQFNYTV